MKRAFIKVTKVTENPDGSATVDFEYGSDFKKIVREYYHRKKCTKKLVKKFMHQAITDTVNYYKRKKDK